MAKLHRIRHRRQIQDQAATFYMQITQGIYKIIKDRETKSTEQLFSVSDVIHLFNTTDKVALEIEGHIYTNFEAHTADFETTSFNDMHDQ